MTSKRFAPWCLAQIYKTAIWRYHHSRTAALNLFPSLSLSLSQTCAPSPFTPTLRSRFSTSDNPALLKLSSKTLPPRPKPPPEEEIEESFLKGSGPGGQKINKTNSAVQLKHLPTGIVVKCQATRSRSQNRTIARQLLADKLDDLTRGEDSRAAVVGKFKGKKKASSAKKSRRKYRKLEEEKMQDKEEEEEGEEEEEEEGEKEDNNNKDGDGEIPVSKEGNEGEHATVDRQGTP